VLFHFYLPHLKCNRIGGIRVHWRHWVSQFKVSNGLHELSSVLGVGSADIVDDLLGCIDAELIGVSLTSQVVDKTFQ
jgi:hypothetical protein